ncbi:MAG: arabinose isomerase, partial [Bacteroidales bacterium]|nr:arabinose isomerase [Bacteroidales bacterium]
MMTKVGLIGIGLDTYWDQFEGLLEKLLGYQDQIKKRIEKFGAEVIDAGMADSPARAREAATLL